MNDKNLKKSVAKFDDQSDMPKPKPLSKRVKSMSEYQIQTAMSSDSDVESIPPDFWDEAVVIMPSEKVKVGIRLDSDVLDWFKKAGKGYQTRINAVLKSYMRTHNKME